MNSFYDLVKNRRSIRHFTPQVVEEDKIQSILTTALMSPASKRSNGWEFWVVNDKEKLALLADCREFGSKLLAGAPLAIVVTADPDKSDVWFEDASIASIIIQLAAADLGLGSCWVQIYGRNTNDETSAEESVRQIVGIPPHLHVLNAIAIGYKDEDRKPYDEEKLSYDKIHWNK